MKIAIITLHYIRNYGSVLQTYATQRALEAWGFDSEIIDYTRPNAEAGAIIAAGLQRKNLRGLRKLGYTTLKKIENIRRSRVCRDFLRQHCRFTRPYPTAEALKAEPPIADIYCTGSDQVWNSEHNGGLLGAYFLDFAPAGARKISLASSIGMDAIKEAERPAMAEYLRQYRAVSVREDRAVTRLQELGISACQLTDPCFWLPREDWEQLAAPRNIQGDYILIYRLTSNSASERFAEKLAEQTGLPIVRVSYYLTHLALPGRMVYTPAVEDFLSLIRHASYVITDSFHGTAFSLIFGREFYAFSPKRYTSRLDSILTLTGTAHRLNLCTPEDSAPIDYAKVEDILAREQLKARDFLRRACEEGSEC